MPIARRHSRTKRCASTHRRSPQTVRSPVRVLCLAARAAIALRSEGRQRRQNVHLGPRNSGEITSNEGFSVVAPINVMCPASTYGKNASCCALLNRCTSSTNTIVRCPDRDLRSATAITSFISLIPASTALNDTNSDRVTRAINRASVVFPHPGGPHSSIDQYRRFQFACEAACPVPAVSLAQ